jgi:TonB family protein
MAKLFGRTVGENFGIGGIGMRNTGRGGGGHGSGTIGVGKLNTGAGAGAAPGHGVMSGVRREAQVPTLRMGQADVRGSLSKEAIRRTIHQNISQVRYCYERALSERPALSGRISIQFLINPSGLVQQSMVGQSSMGHPALDRCVADAVRRWTFPAPEGGGYVHVSYPFVFERAGE